MKLTTNIAFSADAIDVTFQALNVMLKGMIGIFVFMFVFYLLIVGLRKVYKDKERD
ncbi:MAG TPA: hypothetical protein PKZ69_03975 [Candidatus Cloacimonadota bacterium]|nr:hypothetical protein [Candidatus Cloacimonadota bacterium]HOQ80470.1 hypothetical protein [Candidatus Cloacimonadota bacterium]HPK40758.1 hypothetical protein [Candidatus Cloacimonadota bacterium]